VALSMEEQRMLDEMERQLAIADPKLASRFNAFGQQRMSGAFTSQRVKTIIGLLALALIAAVTVMMFVLSPYGAHNGTPAHATSTSSTKGSSHSGSAS
jgi:tetrahydromethanopterin S-methyltransferase subunit B